MARKISGGFVCLLIVATLAFGANINDAAAQTNPVTLYAPGNPIISIDPQLVSDNDSLEVVENLFLGLTDVDPKTSKIRAEGATQWSTNAAGDSWIFTIRTDIPWVQWNPVTKKATALRKVVAGDYEYGIKRACDPRLHSVYTPVAARLIKGCSAVANLDSSQVKDSSFDQIGVKALNDSQLQIQTAGVIPYFFSTTALWIFRAVPKETIAQYGANWTDVGKIVTDGPYVMDVNNPATGRVFVKNPLYPSDVNDNYGGNIDQIIFYLGCNNCVSFAEYQANQLDITPIGGDTINTVKANPQLTAQYIRQLRISVEYFAFNYDSPPFNNVHVRRAFSAIIDRATYTNQVLLGTSFPTDHFIPPGAFGAVLVTKAFIGKSASPGFDPVFARKELAAGGYPNCKGFPTINIDVVETYQAEPLTGSAVTNLGCSPDKFNVIPLDMGALQQMTGPNAPKTQRPNMFSNIWGADYPDGQNFMGDVLGCKGLNPSDRPCGALDKMIDAAATEPQSDKRAKLYAQVEQAMFGPTGEFPVAPVRIPTAPMLVKPWLHGFFQTDGLFAGKHWNTWHIDQAAQLAARPAS